MLFKEIIPVRSENYTKSLNKKYNIGIVKIARTYNYHQALKC
jgi:hypothetical protein